MNSNTYVDALVLLQVRLGQTFGSEIVDEPRRRTVELYASAAMTLSSDLVNLFTNAHSHVEYLLQVSLKAFHHTLRDGSIASCEIV